MVIKGICARITRFILLKIRIKCLINEGKSRPIAFKLEHFLVAYIDVFFRDKIPRHSEKLSRGKVRLADL